MKILFVLEHFKPYIGGVETLFDSLLTRLEQEGHQITVLTTRHEARSPMPENIVEINTTNRYLFTLLALFKVWKLSKHVDLLHTTSYNAALPTGLVAAMRRKPAIVTFHELWGKLWFNLPYMNAIAAALHFLFEKFLTFLPFHAFIGVSEYTCDRLIAAGVSRQKVTRIYNGIDYQKFRASKPSTAEKQSQPLKFVYFGRAGISKGLDLIMESIPYIQQESFPGQVEVVTALDNSKIVRDLRKVSSKYPDVFKLTGHLPETALFHKLRNADAVIIPSYSEGFCFTAAETAAMGIPIIHSGKGALSEVVSGQYILMEEMSGKGLYDALVKAQKGEWQYSGLRQFLLEDCVQGYVELYNKIVTR